MSFGFGVGDFIAVGELAWKLYTNCYKAAKGAPAEYQALLEDLKTSSSLIRMLDEEMKNKASVLGSASSDRVHLMVDTVFQVQVVLQAIQKLAEKYEILSGQSALKRSWKPRFIWERIKWSVELKDVDSLRNKLGQHNTALNLLLTCAGHSSLERLEITSKGIVKDVTEIREYIKKLAYKSQVPSITLPNAVNEDDDMFMVTISATLMRSAERLQPWNTIGVDEWIRNGRWWLLKAQASLEGNLSKGAPIPVQAYADLLKASWILTDIMSSHPQRPFLSSRSNYELQLLNIEVKNLFKQVLTSATNIPQLHEIEDEQLELWDTSIKTPILQAKRVTHVNSAFGWTVEGEEVFFRNFATCYSKLGCSTCMVLILLNNKSSYIRVSCVEQNGNQIANLLVPERSTYGEEVPLEPTSELIDLDSDIRLRFHKFQDATDFWAVYDAARVFSSLRWPIRDQGPKSKSKLCSDEFKFLATTSLVMNDCRSMVARLLDDSGFWLKNMALRRERVDAVLAFARAYLAESNCAKCSTKEVKRILGCFDIKASYIFGPSIFHHLAQGGDESLVRQLENYRYRSSHWRIMHEAALRGDADVMGLLINSLPASEDLWDCLDVLLKAEVNGYGAVAGLFLGHLNENYAENSDMEVSTGNRLDTMRWCLQQVLDPPRPLALQRIVEDRSILYTAIRSGRMEIFQMLMSLGFTISIRHLFEAIHQGEEAAVHAFLDHGADINWKTGLNETDLPQGSTVVHAACYKGHIRLLEFFLAKGLSVNDANVYGELPIHLAARNGDPRIVRFLIDSGSKLTMNMLRGRTPLHYAGESTATGEDIAKTTKLLIDAGVDMNEADISGETALNLAIRHSGYVCATVLMQAGSNVRADMKLMEAVLPSKYYDVVRQTEPDLCLKVISSLLEAGANLDAAGKRLLDELHSRLRKHGYFESENWDRRDRLSGVRRV